MSNDVVLRPTDRRGRSVRGRRGGRARDLPRRVANGSNWAYALYPDRAEYSDHCDRLRDDLAARVVRMTTNPYHRAVVRYLREEYSVDPVLHGGTNHPYVTFPYGGRVHRVTLHNSSAETDILAIKIADIRRVLGSPPPKAINVKRKLEEMMPEPFNPIPIRTVATGTT